MDIAWGERPPNMPLWSSRPEHGPPCGWVYLMVTDSQPGLVKVGKTTRSPDERAADLSRETTAPTPFVVVHAWLTDDCDKAEREAHAELRGKGLERRKEWFTTSPELAQQILAPLAEKWAHAREQHERELERLRESSRVRSAEDRAREEREERERSEEREREAERIARARADAIAAFDFGADITWRPEEAVERDREYREKLRRK